MREGLLRERYYYKGRFHDELIYSELRRDWEKRKANQDMRESAKRAVF